MLDVSACVGQFFFSVIFFQDGTSVAEVLTADCFSEAILKGSSQGFTVAENQILFETIN